jgi:PBSX family phage terminase large subunit
MMNPAVKTLDIRFNKNIFLPCYRHLLNSDADINFLWGGRDSGKSYFIAQLLLLECLKSKYFRCILVKKTISSVKDSQWQTLRDVANKWGISSLFQFKVAPLEIICVNGNKFMARGCDKPERLKSISNPSHAWFEEGNQLTEADYIIASTTLRSNEGAVKEWFSFNPECNEDFENFWLYRIFFKERPYEKTFEGKIEMPNHDLKYTSTHTVYQDNKYCSADRISKHEALKNVNPYYYMVYTKGLWGRRQSGNEFYKCFSYEKHTSNICYDASLPLHISFDFNVNPYMTATVWQIKGKQAMQIDEICLRHPKNTIEATCKEIKRKYYSNRAGMSIYGDPSGRREDVGQMKGYNYFRIICAELEHFNPRLRVENKAPSVATRGNFINTILEQKFGGISILIDRKCTNTINDFMYLKEAPDGGELKEMAKDHITGATHEKYGHTSQSGAYFIVSAFASDYNSYQGGGKSSYYYSEKVFPKQSW